MGNYRRQLLDCVIVLSEPHLRRLVRDYIGYYHEDRVHGALNQETPTVHVPEPRPTDAARAVHMPQAGGPAPSLPVADSRLKVRAPIGVAF